VNPALLPTQFEQLAEDAVRHYWNTLKTQFASQAEQDADRGNRAAVTGGKQMDGFVSLLVSCLGHIGLPSSALQYQAKPKRTLPGFFRVTKDWDFAIVHKDRLLASIELKSHRGPSFGNNQNNRAEEAIGSGTDFWISHREGNLGTEPARPWLGWLMLVEDCEASRKSVSHQSSLFPVDSVFEEASYCDRYGILAGRLQAEKIYDHAAIVCSQDPANGDQLLSDWNRQTSLRVFVTRLNAFVLAYLQAEA